MFLRIRSILMNGMRMQESTYGISVRTMMTTQSLVVITMVSLLPITAQTLVTRLVTVRCLMRILILFGLTSVTDLVIALHLCISRYVAMERGALLTSLASGILTRVRDLALLWQKTLIASIFSRTKPLV